MHTAATTPMPRTTAAAAPLCVPPPRESAALDAGGSTGKLLCPRCEAPILRECVRDGVNIDLCRKCRGIWLDCGELERLIARAMHGRDGHARPALRHLNAREYAELLWDEA
jgi:Zn-finger nucleic acid-binding protein